MEALEQFGFALGPWAFFEAHERFLHDNFRSPLSTYYLRPH
jgi:hypothetical protein